MSPSNLFPFYLLPFIVSSHEPRESMATVNRAESSEKKIEMEMYFLLLILLQAVILYRC